ncbi:MAG: peptidylprolyl isomerase [Actinomycetota bacterium]
MKKLISLVVLGAMLVAACGDGEGSGELAATVDGTEITVDDVNAMIDSEGTVPVADFAQYLAAIIQWTIFFDAAEEEYDVTVTDEEIEEEETQLYEQLANEGESREEFLSSRGITERFLSRIAEQTLVDRRIRETLVDQADSPTDEDIEDARADAMLQDTEVCASHILVETEEEANEALDRLDAGEEFSDVATEMSMDTQSAQNGGDLGCSSPADYVGPFQDAVLESPVGEVNTEPVETEFGFHVILVTDRTEPDADELPSDEDLASTVIETSVSSDLEEWYLDAMESADVTVEEQFGTWSPVPPTVTPPNTDGTGSPTTTILDE